MRIHRMISRQIAANPSVPVMHRHLQHASVAAAFILASASAFASGDEGGGGEPLAIEMSPSEAQMVKVDGAINFSCTPSGGCDPYEFEWEWPEGVTGDPPTDEQNPGSTTFGAGMEGEVKTVKVTVTDAGGETKTSTIEVGVLEFDPELSNVTDQNLLGPPGPGPLETGFSTKYYFKVTDKFTQDLPNAAMAEIFTGSWTSDWSGENWPAASSTAPGLDSSSEFGDEYAYQTVSGTPTTVTPSDSDAGQKVQHVSQEYKIGGSGTGATTSTGFIVKDHKVQFCRGRAYQF